MKLPVRSFAATPSVETLWRRFSDVLFDHAVALGDEIVPPAARGVSVADADGGSAAATFLLPLETIGPVEVDQIFAHCRQHNTSPARWIGPASQAELPLQGYTINRWNVLRVQAAGKQAPPSDVMILPARAARLPYSNLWDAGQVSPGERMLRHLDDPQYEAVLAMRGGVAIGSAAVQIRGETGLICDVYVCPGHRKQGVARALVGRVLDLAARAQLKDVFGHTRADDVATAALLNNAGLTPVATYLEWLRTAVV